MQLSNRLALALLGERLAGCGVSDEDLADLALGRLCWVTSSTSSTSYTSSSLHASGCPRVPFDPTPPSTAARTAADTSELRTALALERTDCLHCTRSLSESAPRSLRHSLELADRLHLLDEDTLDLTSSLARFASPDPAASFDLACWLLRVDAHLRAAESLAHLPSRVREHLPVLLGPRRALADTARSALADAPRVLDDLRLLGQIPDASLAPRLLLQRFEDAACAAEVSARSGELCELLLPARHEVLARSGSLVLTCLPEVWIQDGLAGPARQHVVLDDDLARDLAVDLAGEGPLAHSLRARCEVAAALDRLSLAEAWRAASDALATST